MDQELRETLAGLKKSHEDTETNLRAHINQTGGRLEGKLDLMNQQFNQHLVDDTKQFTILEQRHLQLREKVEEVERKRKEDSERRLQKVEADQTREDQWRIAKVGGVFLIAAAVLGSLVASVMTYVEHRAERSERQTYKAEERK
jgi:hypothetical protein